jgi:hypothetical protein
LLVVVIPARITASVTLAQVTADAVGYSSSSTTIDLCRESPMKEWIANDQMLSAILAPNHCGGELAGTENWNGMAQKQR